MKPIFKILTIFFVVVAIGLACVLTVYQSFEKKMRLREPTLVFYRAGEPAYITEGSIEHAERLMKSNPQFERYEIDE